MTAAGTSGRRGGRGRERERERERGRVDPTLWTVQPVFGPAGGPDEVVLTDEGLARAFSVGAQVRRGPAAEALEALAAAGGAGLLVSWSGPRAHREPLGRFDQIAWGHLKALGYVEADGTDGVRLTPKGHAAVRAGYEERCYFLERCREAAREAAVRATEKP